MQIIWGIFGVVAILALAYLLSRDKKSIKWRTIGGALAIQIIFGFIVLKWKTGQKVFEGLTNVVQSIIDTSSEGIEFLFGGLLSLEGVGTIFAFEVLTVIIFFSSLISVLSYIGVMQFVTKIVGGFLEKILKTSKPESLSASANIFMGITEAPLVVKPFLPRMTKSELFAVMTGGTASVSGSVLIGYSLLGVPLNYLIAAAFMAAPAGLLMAKMLVPETEQVDEDVVDVNQDQEAVNIVDAASTGALVGLKLALNIGALLLAFISLIALINLGLESIGGIFGAPNITLDKIFGIILSPIAFVVGVPWEEAVQAGSYIGEKFTLNEFVAFSSFAEDMSGLSNKTIVVVTFALCGFANLGAMGMIIGGMGGLAPSRKDLLSKYAFFAVIGGTLANLLSAAVAGMLV